MNIVWEPTPVCPKCGSRRTQVVGHSSDEPLFVDYRCEDCGYVSSRRVLVVDDEESNRTFAERVLREAGYEVVVASGGSEALRLVEQQRPFDLFVIDVVMPQMSGNELARQLRQANPDVKVLYFTGFPDQLFKEKPTLWEHEAFVEKPVNIKGFIEAVSLLLFGHTHGPL